MAKAKTHVVLLLDKSGSMASIREPIIRDFNEQIETIQDRSNDLETQVTYVTFNHDVTFEFIGEKADSLKPLNATSYMPRGGTALRDAIGVAIEEVKKQIDETTPVLFVIVSDGMDQSSTKFNQTQIAEMVQEMKDKYAWTFTYVGCDHDVEKVARQYNIPVSNVMKLSKSGGGLKRGMARRKSAYSNYADKVVNVSASLKDGETLKSSGEVMDACYFSANENVTDLEGSGSDNT
jgi:uncharacterized protein YegL